MSSTADRRGALTGSTPAAQADLKLLGRGWLEFQVTPLDDGRRSLLRQTATSDPRGLLGRAYRYVLLPVHEWMFSGLLHEIARVAVAFVVLQRGKTVTRRIALSPNLRPAKSGPA